MQNTLQKHIPEEAIQKVIQLLEHDDLLVLIKNERKTRHGDYRKLPNGKHQITINNNLNKYRFLITLIHEIAHFEAYKNYGKFIKPHGLEWKRTFQHLMLPFINPDVFPLKVLPLIAKHFKNPKASSCSDPVLYQILKQFDAPSDKILLKDISIGTSFTFNKRSFIKLEKKRTRSLCKEVETGKKYMISDLAEVIELSND